MPSTVLIANTGRQSGSAPSRRLRVAEQVPAVVYGHGMAPLSVTVDGTVYPAIIRELQRHPVRRSVTHVDFLQVNLDEQITVHVPLRLEGEATKVLQGGGLVDPSVDTIEVVTTPRHIPDEFVVDISDMDMDTVVRLADLPMPAGVTPVGDPESPVVTVLTMRAELAEIEAADEAAAEEQAEGQAEADDAEAAADGGDAAE